MSKKSFSLLHCLRTMSGAYRHDARNDSELIERFVATHDETAVATLAVRHGPMVWEICRRILRNDEDAEDAYQVTFLALAKQAANIHVKDTVAGWLCQVARRSALNARKAKKSRVKVQKYLQSHSGQMPETMAQKPETDDVYPILYEELAKLSEKQRVVLILHYLEGKTQAEVAEILQVQESAVWHRLARGKSTLLKGLMNRGMALSATTLAAILDEASSHAAMPLNIVAKTVQAATAICNGKSTSGLAKLAEEVLRQVPAAAPWWKANWMISLLCVTGLGLGAGGAAWKAGLLGGKLEKGLVAKIESSPREMRAEKRASTRHDLYGDPLPEGAIARIGTIRFRTGSNPDDERLNGNRIADRVAFLPGAKKLISFHGDHCLHLWDVATGKKLQCIRFDMSTDHGQIAVSPDCTKLAVAEFKPTNLKLARREVNLRLLDVAVNPPRVLWRTTLFGEGRSPAEHEPAFAPDGKLIALGANQNVLLCNVATGKLIRRLNLQSSPNRMIFSPDSKVLAILGRREDGGALWDLTTGRKQRDLEEFQDKDGNLLWLVSWCFSQDGKLLAAKFRAGSDCPVNVWDAATGKLRHQVVGSNDPSYIAFLDDGRNLLESHDEGVRIWNLAPSGKSKLLLDKTCTDPLPVENKEAQTCLSADGKFLAKSAHGVVRVWEASTGQVVGPAGPNGVPALALAPDGRTLVTYGDFTNIQTWETATGRPNQKLEAEPEKSIWLLPRIYHFDGRRIMVGVIGRRIDEHGRFVTYDLPTKRRRDQGDVAPPRSLEHANHFGVSPNGRWAAWSSSDRIGLVERSTQKEVCCSIVDKLGLPKSAVERIQVSADGRSVLLTRNFYGENGTYMQVWQTNTGKCWLSRKVVPPPMGGDLTACFSPDGRWLAFVAGVWTFKLQGKWKNESVVRLIEVASETEGKSIEATTNVALCSVAWSPDGSRLLAGDADGNIWLWDVRDEGAPQILTGHLGGVHTVMFSQNGLMFASASYDATSLIWDLRNLPQPKTKKAKPLPAASSLWEDMRASTADKAWSAMQILVQHPEVAVTLLGERLRPPKPPDERVASLLTKLNADEFKIRRQAEQELGRLSETIEPLLRDAMSKSHSVEFTRSLERILAKVVGSPFDRKSGYNLRDLRVHRGIEVLERIGTARARLQLEKLSQFPVGSVEAVEAKAALQRMSAN